MSGRYEKKREKKPLSVGKVVLTVVAVVLVLVAALGVAGAIYYNRMLGKLNQVEVGKINYTQPTTQAVEETREEPEDVKETEATTEEATEPPHVASSADYLNILLVGQASRDGEAERFADTMILCTINTYEKTLTMTSLLRDTLVKMPDYKKHYGGKIKLTTIYHLGSVYGDGVAGSMELMNQTLYDNFGIEVDYNVEIDFEAFIRVIDRLDGVKVELTQAEADYLTHKAKGYVYREMHEGPETLWGAEALAYARMRKAEGDGESDIKRTVRQRALMNSIVDSLRKKDLGSIQSIINEVLPMVTVSMNNSEITQLLTQLLPMLPDLQIVDGGTCPANYSGDMVDIYKDGMMHSILRFDVEETKKTMREITLGEIPTP